MFHQVELARHTIILARGSPTESSLATGNRAQFGDCAFSDDPIEAASREPCAEMVFAGARLDAARQHLTARAGTRVAG